MKQNKGERKLHSRTRWWALLALCMVCMGAGAQRTFRIMEWNVENVFDTQHDEGHNDEDFLPEGSHHWTANRYWRKLDEVGKTIIDVGDTVGPPALVGLCEVENDTVLRDLTQRSALRAAGYKYVMTDSPDRRGVDVALLYHPSLFALREHHAVRVPSVQHGMPPTRDLLYAKGQLATGDTLHIVVCHLPSKRGGLLGSARHRKLATATLRTIIDSIQVISPQAHIIVMGDFNATFTESIFRRLSPPLHETLPTSRRALRQPIGTYYFQKQWSYLDHILISTSLCSPQVPQAHEARLPHLLDKEGLPHRAYKGTAFVGGISDHLPLFLDLAR